MSTNNSILKHSNVLECAEGVFIPIWYPLENVSIGGIIFRGTVYIAAMLYLFVGLAYLADLFMASIEMITSIKKEIRVKNEQGEEETVVVRIWNQTVANLTLIALGCAAPEILLSIIEIIQHGFIAEELGPSETVASASFNLFVIIGVCIWIIPSNEVRRVKHLPVFLVTASFCIFAYVWLLAITTFISPGIVEVWEALLTVALFPLTVFAGYIADKKCEISNYISKTYDTHRGIIVETDNCEQSEEFLDGEPSSSSRRDTSEVANMEDDFNQQFEQYQRMFIAIMKGMRRKHPDMEAKQLELLASKELVGHGTKSRTFFRLETSKKLTGIHHLK